MKTLIKEISNELIPGKILAQIKHKGFDIICTVENDDHADLSWLGEFSDNPADKFAVPNSETRTRHAFKYFNAENVDQQEHAIENYRRALSYGESWCMYGAIVTIKKNGVELAQGSLWGIESDSEHEYFASTFNELIHETLPQAQATLKSLCAA